MTSTSGQVRNSEIHDRNRLLQDLEFAVTPNAAPTVLALFDFRNLKSYLDGSLEGDGDDLLRKIGKRLADATGRHATLYEPRRGEFGALFSGGLAATQPLLEQAVTNVDKATRPLGIMAVVASVELPLEATTRASALKLVNARQARSGCELRPSRRHSVYALVSNALGRSDELRKSA